MAMMMMRKVMIISYGDHDHDADDGDDGDDGDDAECLSYDV